MKNTIELQLRAARAPRVLKKTDAGIPEFMDIWAVYHCDHSPREWSIAVKFGRETVESALKLAKGTLFTVKGRLDQSKHPTKETYHTFIWADEIFDLVPSRKGRSGPPTPDLPNFPNAETEEETQP